MKGTGLILCFNFFILVSGYGQKYLIVEHAGTPHTKRFGLYDEITFQLKDDEKGWYTRQILDMNPESQMVLFEGDAWMPLADISRIKMPNKRAWAMIIGSAFQVGGASMVFGDLWTTLNGNGENTQGGMEMGLLNMAFGTALKALFGPIKYRLDEHTRLRVIDITFGTIRT